MAANYLSKRGYYRKEKTKDNEMNHINIQTDDLADFQSDQRKGTYSQVRMGCTDRNKMTLNLASSKNDYFNSDANSTRNNLQNNGTNTSSCGSGFNQLKVDGMKVKTKKNSKSKDNKFATLSNDYQAYVDTATKINTNRQSSFIDNSSNGKPFINSKLESLRSSFVYQSTEVNNIFNSKKMSITTKNSDQKVQIPSSLMSPFSTPNATNYKANLLKLEKMNYLLKK